MYKVMKEKLIKVIESCISFKQLLSAYKYLDLYAYAYGTNGVYYDGFAMYQNRVRQIASKSFTNAGDYMDYARTLIMEGRIEEANEFIDFAEQEIGRVEV
jgi:hypothetical protein